MNNWIIIAVLISIMCGAVYFYYSTTQKTINQLTKNITTLEENNKQLENANNTNLKTIDNLQSSYIKIQEDFNKVQDEFQIIRMENLELKNRLGKHELDVLAFQKPELVENVVNNATSNSLRCFELLTGAPLNEKEKNAKTDKQFNSECPWLFNNYN